MDKLKTLLKKSNIDHSIEILKENNLKTAHMYCKINNLSGQISGSLIEKFLQNKYNMSKNNASKCIGDMNYLNDNIEIKISLGGLRHNKFNYVQLRPNHNCNYLLTAYYVNDINYKDLGELFIFYIHKTEMHNLISKFGSYAHGTISKFGKINIKDIIDPKNNKEYALRPRYNSKCWNELLKYRIFI